MVISTENIAWLCVLDGKALLDIINPGDSDGGSSTLTATFMPSMQNPLPQMK